MKTPEPSPAYGTSLPRLLYHDIRDRMRGNRARANARWGWVRAPQGRGKLIWIRAGGSRESVHLAAELLAAIREKRQDVRLVLTFEEDHADLYAPIFQGLKKVAVGYGCCDRPAAVQRMLQRLAPLGVICVSDVPGKHFLKALSASEKLHRIAFQLRGDDPRAHFEACYPLSKTQVEDCDYVAPASQVETIFVPSQVEPNFGALLRGTADTHVWWLHGLSHTDATSWWSAWQAQALSKASILVCSEEQYTSLEKLFSLFNSSGISPIRLSQWQRQALPVGSVVIVDEEKWLPAVAASVDASHLIAPGRRFYWQALAGGRPVSVSDSPLHDPQVVDCIDDVDSLFAHWQSLLDSVFSARQRGDQCRKLFWEKRRQATQVVDELLQRVYDW